MRIRVDNVGSVGVVKDIPPYELPANAWSDCKNVRMQDGSVFKAYGHNNLWTTPEVDPYFLFPIQTSSAYYWVYCGLTKVYAIQNFYHFDITRASGDYTALAAKRWNGGNLGGVLVLNSSTDVPQYWEYPANHGNLLQDLPGWDANHRCLVMKPFKNYLVAINVTKSGDNFPTLVKWSHSADVGEVPTSWDPSDTTLDAGENPLPQEGGHLLDQLPLRDTNILYRSDSTWGMQFIGGNFIWRFFSIFETSGILGTACVQEFYGKHFVVTADDIIVHDGQQIQSVAEDRVRRHFFDDLDAENYDRSFVVHNKTDKEMWICYPSTGNTVANRAWVWSYGDASWSCRDIPSLAYASFGVTDQDASDTWDKALGSFNAYVGSFDSATGSFSTDTAAWDVDDNPWDFRTYNAQLLDIVGASPTATSLYTMDFTNTEASSTMSASVTRTGLALIGQDKTDFYSRKQVRAVYPHIEGTNGGVVKVSVGVQDAVDQTVTWSTQQNYVIGTSYKCDFNMDGRLVATKFESDSDIEWRMHGYQMDIEVSGDR